MNEVIKAYGKLNHRNNKKDAPHLNKHAVHLIRLYLMAIDIFEKEEIITYRSDDLDLLLSITIVLDEFCTLHYLCVTCYLLDFCNNSLFLFSFSIYAQNSVCYTSINGQRVRRNQTVVNYFTLVWKQDSINHCVNLIVKNLCY